MDFGAGASKLSGRSLLTIQPVFMGYEVQLKIMHARSVIVRLLAAKTGVMQKPELNCKVLTSDLNMCVYWKFQLSRPLLVLNKSTFS